MLLVKKIDYVAEEFDQALDLSKKSDGTYNPFDRGNNKKNRKPLSIEKANKYGVISGPEYVLRVCTRLLHLYTTVLCYSFHKLS